MLSPANKIGDGRDQYVQKQSELLARNVIITEPADWRYLIDISRAERRNALEFYAVPLRDFERAWLEAHLQEKASRSTQDD